MSVLFVCAGAEEVHGGVGLPGGPGGGQGDQGREQGGAEAETLQQEGERSVVVSTAENFGQTEEKFQFQSFFFF